MSMVLFTVLRSGMATGVVLVAEHPGALPMATESGALRVLDGAVPMMLTGVAPKAAVLSAVTVTVVDSPAVTVAGSNETLTPLGVGPELNVISSAAPLVTVVAAVTVVDSPAERLAVD